MNTFRMISRVLVVAAVVFAGNACAMETAPKPVDQKGGKFVAVQEYASAQIKGHGNTCIFVAIETALPEDKDAAKAAFDTIGFALDNPDKNDEIDPVAGAVNFGMNYTTRKAIRCLNKNGYNLDSIGNKIDILPTPIGQHVNPVVKGFVSAVGPQAATEIIVGLTKLGAAVVMSYVGGNGSTDGYSKTQN